MLQVKDLVKRYVTKGETVTAIDHVSIDFPETGMVFLLGKSGSGKSTLLNVAGGLDKPDEGEIVVKGKSSKDFTESDFDSYRNTYVGFVFQEYNILPELTVAENIGLALELQGIKRNDAHVEEILKEVDLGGMGDRSSNALSGGQKQRVAIARALVKNPEIIMADEPTGALDSVTGGQVLDTLKKLSVRKLVVVVSHDREFAERYADRIIELADGRIVSDLTRETAESEQRENISYGADGTVEISCGARITDEEAEALISFLRGFKRGAVISPAEEDRQSAAVFTETEEQPRPAEQESAQFIKSRLPFRYALKMGFSGLKVKPLRLAVTAFLCSIAFIVFGVFSTLITFSTEKIGAYALNDLSFPSVRFTKQMVTHIGEAQRYYDTGLGGSHFAPDEIASLRAEFPSYHLVPVYDFDFGIFRYRTSGSWNKDRNNKFYELLDRFSGFADVPYAKENPDIVLAEGRYPESNREGMISLAVAESLLLYGFPDWTTGGSTSVDSFAEIIGKTLSVPITTPGYLEITITGIFDPGEKFERYEDLKTVGSSLKQYELTQKQKDLEEVFESSLSSICFVAEGFYDGYSAYDLSRTRYLEMRPEGSTVYNEPEGSIWKYVYFPLSGDRLGKSQTFLYSINRRFNAETDVRYLAEYTFLTSALRSKTIFDDIFGLLGGAAFILAVFSSLLLYSFISASIAAKRKEIGILRAVGARGADIFKIFLIEGVILTALCFTLACLGSVAACAIVNDVIIAAGVFGYRFFLFDGVNAAILLALALIPASIGTTLPVAINSRKNPVEAIRAV